MLRNLLPALLRLFKSLRWPSQISYMPEIQWVGQEQKTGPSLSFVHSRKPTDPVEQEYGLVLTEPHRWNMGHMWDKLSRVLHTLIALLSAI